MRALTTVDVARFWSKVEKIPFHTCWEWTGTLMYGYGYFGYAGKLVRAHRLSWRLEHGKAPTRLVLHRCDNRSCINPDHLFVGSQLDNVLDAVQKGRHANASKTCCKRGHPLTAENVLVRPGSGGGLQRRCRRCQRLTQQERRKKANANVR